MSRRVKTKLGQIVEKLSEELCPSRWADIDHLREQVRSNRLIDREDPEIAAELMAFAEGELIRRAMRRKDEEGFPLFPSILIPKKDGEKRKRMYMSEARMKPIHYREFGVECHGRVAYWQRLENATIKRANQRYHMQWELPWPDVEQQNRKAS